MDPQFWIKAWQDGRTNFHRTSFHEKLLQFFPCLDPAPGESVLVPLCGKSKDLLWLLGQGLQVQGVELYQGAVTEFFSENELPTPKVTAEAGFTNFTLPRLQISCGDFFNLPATQVFELIYDRAALIALPVDMRAAYVEKVLESLKPGGRCLLISMEYEQSELEGPPFSVTEKEISALYGSECRVELLHRGTAVRSGRFTELSRLDETVYLIEKN